MFIRSQVLFRENSTATIKLPINTLRYIFLREATLRHRANYYAITQYLYLRSIGNRTHADKIESS